MDEYLPREKPSYPLILDLSDLSKRFSIYLKNPLFKSATDCLVANGPVYFVGGMVRDMFLGIESHDIDIALGLHPEEMKSLLVGENFRVIDTGVEHGTVTFLIDEAEGVEATTFRKPSAREATEYGLSIEEDLSGRDFTINAIAYDLESEELVDPFGGVQDLENGVCKAVGDPIERFTEDPLRILRMVRFSVAEGRTLDLATKDGAKSCIELLRNVSVERVRSEFVEIFTRRFPDDALHLLLEIGAIEILIPELLPCVGCEQNEFHIHDVFDHIAWVVGRSKSDPVVRFAALFHDIGKPQTVSVDEQGRRHFYKHEYVGAQMTRPILERLKFSKSDTKRIVRLVKQHMRPFDCGPAGVRRIMRDLEEDFDLWLAIKRADPPPIFTQKEFLVGYNRFMQMVEDERERSKAPSYGKLALNGDDLISYGLKPGPELGGLLKKLEEVVIEDPAKNSKEILLQELESLRNE